ncbi:hypothetical protein WN944_023963 [Citrus x changshan-huyou]|uniref:Uncharacterized protein n=1 Tax=Citrus x changshan-huyou TaxID=2935761 RepID=A0AAP0QA77_9ROSI
MQSTFFSELMIVILIIELAYEREWLNLRIKCDSMLRILHLCNGLLSLPWTLIDLYKNCLLLMEQMEMRFCLLSSETSMSP